MGKRKRLESAESNDKRSGDQNEGRYSGKTLKCKDLKHAQHSEDTAVEREEKVPPKPQEHKKAPAVAKEPCIQVIVGSYEKVLHGFTASMDSRFQGDTQFADTFMLAAHTAAIKSLAISPPAKGSDRIFLASGGSDQVINLYSLSTESVTSTHRNVTKPDKRVAENARNREIGSLQHHAGSVNALCFATKSKLLSGADDSTLAVARTRDWTVLSTIKAPLPKAHGRPSGDTAAAGEVPGGITDFAVHPSTKLMISVSKGERCMRLWNLVTGKKAAVLNFDRNLLRQIGESKFLTGEARRLRWSGLGESFVVGFERGAIVYATVCLNALFTVSLNLLIMQDSLPRFGILPNPLTKIHQIRYFSVTELEIMAVSTEDGRILLYDGRMLDTDPAVTDQLPIRQPWNRLGDIDSGRVKDFDIVPLPDLGVHLIVAGSSDGAVRIWCLDNQQLHNLSRSTGVSDIGRLIATYETGLRITCLAAFALSHPNET